MLNTSNTTSELAGLQESWKTLSQNQLQQELGRYFAAGEMEKGQQLLDFINLQKDPSQVKSKHTSLQETYQTIQTEKEEIRKKFAEERKNAKLKPWTKAYETSLKDEAEAIQKHTEDFFKKDMQTYISDVWGDIDALEASKNSQIDDLKNQLSGIVSHGPKLNEYLSLKRRRLVSINSYVAKLKEDKEHYPKNVLIFLMGIMKSSFFGIRQALKRGRMKLAWKRKSSDIKKNLQIIEEKIKVSAKDSAWTIWLKKQIQMHIYDAKKVSMDKHAESLWLNTPKQVQLDKQSEDFAMAA